MKINRILFIVLMLMVVSLVGCGGHSHSNPMADDSNGGLVNVRGKVANVSDTAKVTFYTLEAAMKNGLTGNASVRASINNEGIYTVDTDKAGNYSIDVPENTYYIVAEEGNKMAVSSRQSISSRASLTTVNDIILAKTTSLTGYLSSTAISVANLPVFIENTPFMCVSDVNGKFIFSKVPVIDDSGSYEVVSYITVGGIRYSGIATVSSGEVTAGSIQNSVVMLQDSSMGSTVSGHVYYLETESSVADHNVMAVMSSGKVYTSKTDANGKYTFTVAPAETSIDLTADMVKFTSVSVSSASDVLLYVARDSSKASNGSLNVTEPCSKEFSFQNSMNTFAILQNNGGKYEKFNVGSIGTPVTDYLISDIPAGDYCYVIISQTIDNMIGCKFTDDFSISAGQKTNVTAQHTIEFARPTIMINGKGYYACNIDPSNSPDATALKCYTVAIKASDEDGTITELDHGVIGAEEAYAAKIDFSKLPKAGEYTLWIELKFNVNGFEQIFESDRYPYVNPISASSSTIGG